MTCHHGLFFALFLMAAFGYIVGLGIGAAVAVAYLTSLPKQQARD
jgi:hypothetical protein